MRSTAADLDPSRSVRPTRLRLEPLAAKVPEITVLFWVIKVLTTGMGEAASDFLGETSLVLAGVVGVFGFAGAHVAAVPHPRVPRAGVLVRRGDGRGVRHHGR